MQYFVYIYLAYKLYFSNANRLSRTLNYLKQTKFNLLQNHSLYLSPYDYINVRKRASRLKTKQPLSVHLIESLIFYLAFIARKTDGNKIMLTLNIVFYVLWNSYCMCHSLKHFSLSSICYTFEKK